MCEIVLFLHFTEKAFDSHLLFCEQERTTIKKMCNAHVRSYIVFEVFSSLFSRYQGLGQSLRIDRRMEWTGPYEENEKYVCQT